MSNPPISPFAWIMLGFIALGWLLGYCATRRWSEFARADMRARGLETEADE